jgi:putative ABC transport system permease protein
VTHPEYAHPAKAFAPAGIRWRTMIAVAWRMMFHNKLKMAGTLIGVVFAVILSNQQAGTFMGLIKKNTMFVDYSGADLWIVPPSTLTLQASKPMGISALYTARATPGVAWAEPLLYAGAAIQLPAGGSEPIQFVGTAAPRFAGGPWNVVAGTRESLMLPNTMVFEDSERERLGGLNLGSVREVSGTKVRVGGITWGLLPFGPSFAFAEYELARRMLRVDQDQTHFVLLGLAPGADPEAVKSAIMARAPEVKVLGREEFRGMIVSFLLRRTPIGITFGTSTLFALIVGFVIVSLSMFSSVVDNIREFGTLKAIGATNGDLAKIVVTQSITFALMGSLIGLAAVTRIAAAIRSPKLAIQLPPQMLIGTTVVMVLMCVAASSLAVLRLRKVEPGMVFR